MSLNITVKVLDLTHVIGKGKERVEADVASPVT